ncbi:DUF4097 family beta strand repeat-containing protein [Actinomycetospora cinnamomea]|uniref:Adhesin n=1 Tax=Actinomycetospora cinnamomea TaxID=663609 RepID=A0A2U1FQI3_9PSEU|nr:hypothetical protein [Actinomycetospora cinnamomea]PVZ14404.1 hypothetical protein C8D89_101268 [Actinomycetospora cinnamomea]
MTAPAREVAGSGAGPATLDLALDAGTVRVRLATTPDTETVRARVDADPDAPLGWLQGLQGLAGLTGLAGLLGLGDDRGAPAEPEERAAAAVAATTLDWDADTRRLTVRGPRDLALRGVPLAVTVRAPEGSEVQVRAGAARVVVDGSAGEVAVRGTGEVTLDEVTGRADLRCGAGEVHVARLAGPLTLRGGAGGVRLDRVLAPAEITTGAGRIRIGEVHADVAVRAAAGDVEVADAVAGDVEIGTGVGTVWVGVHAGVDARVELRAAVGRVHSELPVHRERPAGEQPETRPLRLRARTGAGDVTVAPARPRPALTP